MNGASKERTPRPRASLIAHIRFIEYLFRHKYFVLCSGRKLEVPLLRLLVHDLSKLGPAEYGPYVRRASKYLGGRLAKNQDSEEFQRAWTHHWQHNAHHWEHWVAFGDGNTPRPLEMPDVAIREMVADWLAASRVYTGSWLAARDWYAKHGAALLLAPPTRRRAEELLAEAPRHFSY